MESSLILIVVGALIASIGGMMQVSAAFRQSIWWGLGFLFVPFVNLAFIVVHWSKAKTGSLASLAGLALILGGVVTSPRVREAISIAQVVAAARSNGQPPDATTQERISKLLGTLHRGNAAPADPPAPDLNAQIQDRRDLIEQKEGQFATDGEALARRYQQLTARRNALKPNDTEALAAFNTEAAAYQAQNNQRRLAVQEIATQRRELDLLLDQRSHQTAAATNGRKVILYSTQSCPACKMARSYLAEKKVPYEERDVNSSPQAREEFQKLGGRGVPLILVGTQKMEGFDSQELDRLLL